MTMKKFYGIGLWLAIAAWAAGLIWAFAAFLYVRDAHAGSGGQAEMLLCMSHVSRVDGLKNEGMTREAMHASFDEWLATAKQEPTSAANQEWYPAMVRKMIDSAYVGDGWQHEALRACVAAVKGKGV
jgi:hypothetical protein